MNLYAFVHNNPLNHFDEYGLLDFGQYKTNYHEQQSEALAQITTPLAHAIVKASELYAYADFEEGTLDAAYVQTKNNYINSISHSSQKAHAWVDQNRLEIADFAVQTAISSAAVGVAARAAKPILQGTKWAYQTARGVKTTHRISSPAFAYKSTLIPKPIHKVKPAFTSRNSSSKTGSLNLTPSNYFETKTYAEMEKLLTMKFKSPRPGAPGGKSFFNPRSGRTFHLHQHPGHMRGKPHVDIRRRGPYLERKYLLKDEGL